MKRPLFCAGMAFALGEAMYIFTDRGLLLGVAVTTLLFGAYFWDKLKLKKESVYIISVAWLLGVLHAFCFCRESSLARDARSLSIAGVIDEIQEDGTCILSVRGQSESSGLQYKDKIIIYKIHSDCSFAIGDSICLQGEYYAYTPPTNPGGFDQRLYYGARGIRGYMFEATYVQGMSENEKQGGYISGVEKIYYFIKRNMLAFRDICKRQIFRIEEAKTAGIYAGMLLGDKYELTDDVKDLYKRASVYHLMIISGMHISLLGGLVQKLLKKIRCGIGVSYLTSLLIVLLYGVMTGMALATMRAIIMLVVAMIGEIIGENNDMPTSMTIALLILLVKRPERIMDGGVQLSFAAILGVSLGQYVLRRFGRNVKYRQLKKKHKMRYYLINAFVMGICIQVVMAPVIGKIYFEIATYSLLVNLLVIPLLSVVVICGGLGLLVSFVHPGLALWIIWPGTKILDFYEWICKLSLQLPASHIPVGHVSLWQMLLYYGTVLTIVFVCVNSSSKKIRLDMRKHLCFLSLFLCVVGECSLYRLDCYEMVTVLDVGQGQGILIRGKKLHAVIDGGSSSSKNLGEYTVIPALKYLHMQRIDAWFVSHTDEDHISGLLYILEQENLGGLMIKQIVISEGYQKYGGEDAVLAEIITLARMHKIPVVSMKPGEYMTDGYGTITCLHPSDAYVQGQEESDKNSSSLGIAYRSKDIAVLILGDMDEVAIDYMLANEVPMVQSVFENDDVGWSLILPHHGSKYSMSEELYNWIGGTAFISCGYKNRYGHPHQEVLEELTKRQIPILRTDELGAIEITKNKNKP